MPGSSILRLAHDLRARAHTIVVLRRQRRRRAAGGELSILTIKTAILWGLAVPHFRPGGDRHQRLRSRRGRRWGSPGSKIRRTRGGGPTACWFLMPLRRAASGEKAAAGDFIVCRAPGARVRRRGSQHDAVGLQCATASRLSATLTPRRVKQGRHPGWDRSWPESQKPADPRGDCGNRSACPKGCGAASRWTTSQRKRRPSGLCAVRNPGACRGGDPRFGGGGFDGRRRPKPAQPQGPSVSTRR